MRWLLNALSTSVGRKVVLAITGLLLCGFLVAHLFGNLLLHAGDDGKSYNEYAHALHKQAALLAVAEVGLFGLFIAHIVIALQVSAENRVARKVGYAVTRSKQEGRYAADGYRPDTWMLLTGIVVLGFLILHLMDFKFELRGKGFYETEDGTKLEPFDKAKNLLSTSNLITIVGYAAGSFALLAHLAHGVQSAFQTLGVNHPKYTPLIKLVGLLFAIAIGIGFASFPLVWGPSQGGSPTTPKRSAASAIILSEQSLPPVPTPPPGTLKGVDDSRIRPANFQEVLENRAESIPPETQEPVRPRK